MVGTELVLPGALLAQHRPLAIVVGNLNAGNTAISG
jgi:hypothetical protein